MKIANSWLNQAVRMGLGLALVVLALTSVAHATGPLTPAAPEIDPSSIGSALTLLTGGALLLTGRSRKS
jgi:hypothetical protein